MITTRTATAAALLTFSLAGLGGAVVAIAAPAHADTTTSTHIDGTTMTGTAGPAVQDAATIPNELEDATRGPNVAAVPTPGSAATTVHVTFPHNPAPHSDHDGQGHKGSNEHHGR
jgi:hypothetical protein